MPGEAGSASSPGDRREISQEQMGARARESRSGQSERNLSGSDRVDSGLSDQDNCMGHLGILLS